MISLLQKDAKRKISLVFSLTCKAFDSIDNNILIKKLEIYGIRGPFNKLIKSYLSNRKCLTTLNGVTSKVNPIKYGVPQGSVIGPTLFSLFINDIKKFGDNSEINLFADDTNIFCVGNSYE